MFRHHILQSLRTLSKHKGYSLLHISGFAVGFSVFLILTLFAYKEYTVDRAYEHHKSIFRVIDARKNSSRIDFDLASQLRDQHPDIQEATPLYYVTFGGSTLYLKKQEGGDHLLIHEVISTTNAYFSMFSVDILSGNPERPFEAPNSVVLTRSSAMKLFGRLDVVGEPLNLMNIFDVTVSAVCEDLPVGSSLGADMFFNGENEEFRFTRTCTNGVCYNPVDHYLRLHERTDPKLLADRINSQFPAVQGGVDSIWLQPLTDIYMNASAGGLNSPVEGNRNKAGSPVLIRFFIAIGLLVLLLSVINYVNFSLSRQLSTLRQTGIKITNGAGPGHLISYYFTEVSLSVLVSFALALGLTWLLLPFAGNLLGTSLEFAHFLSPVLLGVCAAVVLTVILISALAPETPMVYSFIDDVFDAFYQKEERQRRAIGFFSLITVLITCLGLTGQIFQACQARTKEIGVRVVNGAQVSEVMMLLNRNFVVWVLVAFILATPPAWYAMHQWLESFAYKTELSWWIFVLSGLLVLLIALLTVSAQSWKAATRNPVESLRYE